MYRTYVLGLIASVMLLAALAVVLMLPGTLEASTDARDTELRNRITALIDNPARPSALWGIQVVNLETGNIVYSRNADIGLVPASNQKIITTAAALHNLGPDYRFVTGLYFEGRADDSELNGDLILRGAGDPSFGSSLDGRDPLARWARELRGMGITRISGRIIGDPGTIIDDPYAPGWDIDYIATASWAPPVGGLSYAENLVHIEIAGTRNGTAANVRTSPSGYVDINGGLETRSGRGFSPLRITRNVGTNDIRLTGAVSPNYRGTVRIPIHDPARFTLHTFAESLRRYGITVDAELVSTADLVQRPGYNSDPLFVHVSPPLVDILAVINQRSNNFYAEQVFRSAGSARTAALRAMNLFDTAGASTRGVSIRDGSGLSRKNLITPQALTHLLAYMHRNEHRDVFMGTLAQSGQPASTLRFRLGGVPVWAKTGSLEHVRALSGYVRGPDGTMYAFSLIANNFTVNPAAISGMQDDIVLILSGRTPTRR